MVETFGLFTSTSTTATAHKYSPFQFKIGLFHYQQFLSVFGVTAPQLLQSCPKVVKRHTFNMHVACTEHVKGTCVVSLLYLSTLLTNSLQYVPRSDYYQLMNNIIAVGH